MTNPRCIDHSDIIEHMPDLTKIAMGLDLVVEFGVRLGGSTRAIIAGKPKKFISYDIVPPHNMNLLREEAKNAGVEWIFIQADSRKVDIPECDFLMIDTDHTYECLKAELVRHKTKAKIIGFHDTVAYKAMNRAIDEECGHWPVLMDKMNNNGFRLIENPEK